MFIELSTGIVVNTDDLAQFGLYTYHRKGIEKPYRWSMEDYVNVVNVLHKNRRFVSVKDAESLRNKRPLQYVNQ